jgi:hypothetical protein
MKALYVIPIYPPHYHFAYKLIESFKKYELNADLMFVFTTESDKNAFENNEYLSMVLPNEHQRIDRSTTLISLKKYCGLLEAKKLGYKYAAAIDSESQFVKSVDSYACMEKYCTDKFVVSSPTYNSQTTHIVQSPFKFFDAQEVSRLMEITKGNQYFWFNNMCIYDLDAFEQFIQKVPLIDFINKGFWMDFEYIIYMYYCFLYQGYNIVYLPPELDISQQGGGLSIMEFIGNNRQGVDTEAAQRAVDFIKPYWLPHAAPASHENVFLIYHYDRT